MRAGVWGLVLGLGLASAAAAEVQVREVPLQYIAALGAADASAGNNAQDWGHWELDPGPRGVWLSLFPALKMAGVAPAGWSFDPQDWWLEEHGLIMEAPTFPLAPGQYMVTGGRQVTTVLTIGEPDALGAQSWSLADGARLLDVTHVGCRAARYSPKAGAECSPEAAPTGRFPLQQGDTMPGVKGCAQQDYAVLFLIGVVEES
jgi:hypothetical protein